MKTKTRQNEYLESLLGMFIILILILLTAYIETI